MDDLTGSLRAERKDEHLKYFLESRPSEGNGFEDVVLQNDSLPDIDFGEINTEYEFLGKKTGFPIMINAMTGGTEHSGRVNEQLALLARKFSLPIAVGSQTVALENEAAEETFRIVRRINTEGTVIANLSANTQEENALKAVAMLDADAIQLHLNAAQEICMTEGDRNFRGILNNIVNIKESVKIPVIVKETGFGISFEVARKLYEAGIKYIDIGGRGGTNFVAIENRRNKERDYSFLENWGIPTALSLLECRNVSSGLHIICTGGITKAEEIVKALCMGADIAGISGVILRILIDKGYDAAEKFIEGLIHETRVMMLLLGAKNIQELKNVPYLLKGELKELYTYKFA